MAKKQNESNADYIDELARLEDLKQKGVLTSREFKKQKIQLLRKSRKQVSTGARVVMSLVGAIFLIVGLVVFMVSIAGMSK